jgi:N-carbamoylputrescine amidase
VTLVARAADLVITADPAPSPARVRPAERPALRVGLVQECWQEDAAAHRGALADGIAGAAQAGATMVFLQELMLNRYFAVDADPSAAGVEPEPVATGPTFNLCAKAATAHGIHVHGSLWEQADDGRRFNTAIFVSPEGSLLSATRKTHIPHFPGYHEHHYFEPGDTPAVPTEAGRVQIGFPTCWDQWFPELSRTYALNGADLLVYPTAIGSEPLHPDWDTQPTWQAAMVGQAVTNGLFVIAVNRTGVEGELRFYGSSFVADPFGRVLVEAPRDVPAVLVADLDLDARRDWLEAFPMLGDRRPEMYGAAKV